MAEEVYRIEIPVNVEDNTEPALSNAERKISGFDKTVVRTRQHLDRLNRTRFQLVIHALDRASGVIRHIGARARQVAGRTYQVTIRVLDLATRPVRAIVGRIRSSLALLSVGAGIGGVIIPIKLADDFSQAFIGFETMLKSAEKANKLMAEVQQFAKDTPFGQKEVVDQAKGLLVRGFGQEEIIPMLTKIGNVAAAMGGGTESIERIVYALGQMRALGRVSAEDMNQLTDAGVQAWKYIAQGMGKSIAEVRKLSEQGLLPANAAIQHILKGMEEFDGMMTKTANLTARGLAGQIMDAFSVQILTRWGKGLQSAVIPWLGKINEWMDKNQDKIARWGDVLQKTAEQSADWVLTKLEQAFGYIQKKYLDNPEFQKLDFGGKIRFIFDDLAGMFDEWWQSKGQAQVEKISGQIGGAIGGGLGGFIMSALGAVDPNSQVQESPFIQAGATAGHAFLESFLEAFDAGKIAGKALEALANIQPEWLGGGNDSGVLGQGLALALDAWLIAKIIGLMKGPFKAGRAVANWMRGGAVAETVATAAASTATATKATRTTVAETATRTPWYRRWRGAAPTTPPPPPASPVANLPPNYRPAGKQFWSNIPLDQVHGRAEVVRMANAGQLQRYNQASKAFGGPLANAAKQTSRFGKVASVASGGLRLMGRSILGLMGPIGWAVTGISLAAEAWGLYKEHQARARQELLHMGDALRSTTQETSQVFEQSKNVQALVDEYRKLDGIVRDNSTSTDELFAAKQRLAEITTILQGLYPDLISNYAVENDKVAERLGMIEKEIGLEEKLARMKLESTIQDAKPKLPELASEIDKLQTDLSNYEQTYNQAMRIRQNLQDIMIDWAAVPLDQQGDKLQQFIDRANTEVGQEIDIDFNIKGITAVMEQLDKYTKITDQNLSEYETAFTELQAAQQSVQDYYNASKTMIELDFGGDVTGGASQLEMMVKTLDALRQNIEPSAESLAKLKDILPIFADESATGADKQKALEGAIFELWKQLGPAIDKLKLLNDEVAALPNEKKVNVQVLYEQLNTASAVVESHEVNQPKVPTTSPIFTNQPKMPTSSDYWFQFLPHANGGLMTQPHIGLVGEAGPEMIIPLSAQRRSRGLDLWNQAGQMLGVRPYEMGGLVGADAPDEPIDSLTSSPPALTSTGKPVMGVSLGGVTVNINMDGAGTDVLSAIRDSAEEVGDLIGSILVQRIEDAAQNSV